jgi:hypothetical protein
MLLQLVVVVVVIVTTRRETRTWKKTNGTKSDANANTQLSFHVHYHSGAVNSSKQVLFFSVHLNLQKQITKTRKSKETSTVLKCGATIRLWRQGVAGLRASPVPHPISITLQNTSGCTALYTRVPSPNHGGIPGTTVLSYKSSHLPLHPREHPTSPASIGKPSRPSSVAARRKSLKRQRGRRQSYKTDSPTTTRP